MNTKKIIAFILWITAFTVPFHYGVLSTEENDYNGHGNLFGLACFVASTVLLFGGYWMFDSAGSKKAPAEDHGH